LLFIFEYFFGRNESQFLLPDVIVCMLLNVDALRAVNRLFGRV